MRIDGRKNDQVRHTKVTRNYIKHAEGMTGKKENQRKSV